MLKRVDGYEIRPLLVSDVTDYYEEGFNPIDPKLVYFTGGQKEFSKEEITSYVEKVTQADDRYDFVILNPDGNIIGEVVLNEIEDQLRQANFRILLFSLKDRHHGIGTWATQFAIQFAFEELQLHRLSLEVFSYNKVAQRLYQKVGFREEGRLRHAIMDGESYADIILMSILEDEYNKVKSI